MTREHCYWQSELDKTLRSIKAKKNILLLGPEKMGKSSFLLDLSENLSRSKSVVPIIFSAENCITLTSYIKTNLLRLLSAYKGLFGERPEEFFSLSLLELDKRVSSLKLSAAAKESLKLLLVFENDPMIKLDDVVTYFFEFPSVLAEEANTASVVLVDDANLLAGIKSDKTSLSVLFDIIESCTEHAVFVLASSVSMKLEGFDKVSLGTLSLDSTRHFFAENDMELSEAALSTVFNITEGVPFYLNFFARLISLTGAKKSPSINALLEDALNNELHMCFAERLKLLSPKERPILFCMAEHKVNTPSRISKLLNYSQTNIRRFLSIMEEKGFVTLKERGVFEIHDPVFRRWLEKQSSTNTYR